MPKKVKLKVKLQSNINSFYLSMISQNKNYSSNNKKHSVDNQQQLHYEKHQNQGNQKFLGLFNQLETFYQMPQMDTLQKQVHSQTLVYDAAKRCEVSPENVPKRKLNTLYPTKSEMDNQGIFTTKISLTQNLMSVKIKNQNQSRVGIYVDSGQRSFSKSSYDSPQSPSKRFKKAKNWTKKKRSREVIHQIQNYQNQEDQTCQQTKVNKNNQSHQEILKLVRVILTSSPKLLQMLTFLTLDINRDGIITEDQLNFMNNSIDVQCALTDDINNIIQYAAENTQLRDGADLPLEFFKMQTYKQYLKINQENKDIEIGSVRGIYRLFSFQAEKQDKKFDSAFPTIGQKTIDLNKKKIRINFQTFQKIYSKSKSPNFIQDLATHFLGKNHQKQQQESISSPRKTNISTKRRENSKYLYWIQVQDRNYFQ